jgi:hypothetical protein
MASQLGIASVQGVIGLLLILGIWLGLPARWWPVDVLGTALALGALSAAAIVLIPKARSYGLRWVRIVLWAELVLGTLTITLLGASMAQLAGSYGPVGGGGALLMGTIVALILPYLVALPALQLRALSRVSASAAP